MMAFRWRISSTWAAVGVALVLSAMFTTVSQAQEEAPAQNSTRGNNRALYTPASGAKDLRAVLFNWAWYTGMLRAREERELIGTLEYQGKGTIQVNGQACTLTKYRVSTNYLLIGQRVNYTCTLPNGQTYSNIEDVSGEYAWDEDIPGAELVAGKGKATPMPKAVDERLIRLWAGPQGALKAAMAGVQDPPVLGQNPGTYVPEGVSSAGKTSVTWDSGKAIVSFPIPGVTGAVATATLNNKYMAERVVVKQGANVTEFVYSDYQDWNNPLNKVEAYYAGKITESKNGKVVSDLQTTVTETGQVYVEVPVPASVKAAIKPATEAPNFTQVFKTTPPDPNLPTPRLADGHPDLTGVWGAPGPGPNGAYGDRRCGPTQSKDCVGGTDFTTDYEFYSPSRYGPSHPNYKPEFWDKIQEQDQWTNKYDPIMTCAPMGLPREGTPRRIFQTVNDVTFLYASGDAGGGTTEHRVIPTDGRAKDPKKELESFYLGYTVGHWEGDTLVLDADSFVDSTWLGRGGYFHSDQMEIIEKFTRKGDTILYEETINDPVDFVEPWVRPAVTLYLDKRPGDGLVADRTVCDTYETGHAVTQIRH
jgi:hypothetical protein